MAFGCRTAALEKKAAIRRRRFRLSPNVRFRPEADVAYLRKKLKAPSRIRAYRQNFGSQNTQEKESENVLDFQTIPPATSLEQRQAHGPEATAQTQGDMVDPGRSLCTGCADEKLYVIDCTHLDRHVGAHSSAQTMITYGHSR